jgi:hypothetical protein
MARKDLFDSMVPEFLSGWHNTIYLGLFCAVFAIIISSFVVSKTIKAWRVVNILIIILSLILVAINLMFLM